MFAAFDAFVCLIAPSPHISIYAPVFFVANVFDYWY